MGWKLLPLLVASSLPEIGVCFEAATGFCGTGVDLWVVLRINQRVHHYPKMLIRWDIEGCSCYSFFASNETIGVQGGKFT